MALDIAAPSPLPANAPVLREQTESAKATEPGASAANPAGEDEASFWDLLDVVNPLQHIPVVGSIYRAITGDEIKTPARIIGGALFGGPVGFMASIANSVVAETTGKDPGAHVIAGIFGDDSAPADAATAVAQDAEGAKPAEVADAAAGPGYKAVLPADAPEAVRHMFGGPAASGPAVAQAATAPAEPAPASKPVPASPAQTAEALPPAPQPAQAGPGVPAPERKQIASLRESQRFYPLPGRNTSLAPIPSAARSTPTAQAAPTEAKPAPASVPPAAVMATPQPGMPGAGDGRWPPGGPPQLPKEFIADAMMNALSKYEQTSRLGGRPALTTTPPAAF